MKFINHRNRSQQLYMLFFLLFVFASNPRGSAQTIIPAHAIYAKVVISNVTRSKTGDAKDNTYSATGDVSICFYADAECTMPCKLMSAMTVILAETHEKDNDESAVRKDYNNEYTVPAGASGLSLGNMSLVNNHSYYDSFWHHYNNTWSYTVAAGTTNKYTPMPTMTK